MAYWLTRDEGEFADYELWESRPTLDGRGYRLEDAQPIFLSFPIKEFQAGHNLRLKPGEIKKVKSITIELEDK